MASAKLCKNCRRTNKEDGDYCAACLAGPKCETEECGLPREKNCRFCKQCGRDLLKKLKDSGHLTAAPRFPGQGNRRPAEAKEDTYVTKHGTGR